MAPMNVPAPFRALIQVTRIDEGFQAAKERTFSTFTAGLLKKGFSLSLGP
jgi:hypothetical protein